MERWPLISERANGQYIAWINANETAQWRAPEAQIHVTPRVCLWAVVVFQDVIEK